MLKSLFSSSIRADVLSLLLNSPDEQFYIREVATLLRKNPSGIKRELDNLEKVLEVGTGSGYQAAVMSHFAETVYTVERIEPLLMQARRRFIELRRRNIRTHHSDGNWGWPEREPFDGIIVTAAPVEIPKSLLQQLKLGGRLVMPVGQGGQQELILVTRTEAGFDKEVLNHVSFVPMLGGTL